MQKSANIFELFTEQNILNKPYQELSKSLYKFSEKAPVADSAADIQPYRPAKQLLRELIGKTGPLIETIGPHPDFDSLESDEQIYHYIVSVFVDIKGSTRLAAKLPLEDVRFIKNGLLVTAIDIFQAFDGHVHRLQGDAVFSFFGGKSTTKADAIVDALNATSTLQYWVKNSLSPLFESMDLPAIRIRTGLDFGDDVEVLWTRYGIKNTSEITTTSVHTDLAAKLQSKAHSNNIMIGNAVVTYLDLPDEFYQVKKVTKDGQSVDENYVMKNEFLTYRMWSFNWEKYFLQSEFAQISDDSRRLTTDFTVTCEYREPEEETWGTYRSNCGTLPKGLKLRFSARIPQWVRYDNIIWTVENHGAEAAEHPPVRYPMNTYSGKTVCFQETAYKGHHYMHCDLKYQGRQVQRETFPIFINSHEVGRGHG